MTLLDVTKEVIWINKFTIEFGVVISITDLIELYYDNNGQ